MGLFDSYAPAQTGGGLIDRLLAQFQEQSQYQPSQGFAQPAGQPSLQQQPLNPVEQQMMSLLSRPGYQPGLPDPVPGVPLPPGASPQAVPAAPIVPPERAAPIAIGGYQMPRVGNPDLYQPQQVDTPAAAQPTQGQQQAAAPFLQNPYQGGGLGGAFRGAMANAHTGLLGMVGGAIAGASGMGTGNPQDIQQRNLQAQYQSLIAAGLPPHLAQLAVLNPEFAKTIIPQALSNKQKFVQLKDGMGIDHPAFVDETAQTVNGQPIADYNKQQAAVGGGGGLGNMDLTGKEYLASLPKSEANIVQQMVEGTIAPPSSFALGKPIWAARLAAAKNYDPTFDATNWSGRVKGVQDFSAGKSSEMVRSANQTLHHVGSLLDSMDNLNNTSYPLLNRIENTAAEAVGSGAQGAFRTNAHAVAEELSKVFKGNNLSDSEIRAWEQNLHENMSPEQQRTQVAKLGELLQGSLQALEEKRQNSIGPIAAEKQGPLIKEEGQRVLKRIEQWTRQGTGAAQGVAPAQTKTGVSWSIEK